MGRYKSSESKVAHSGEPDDAFLESLEQQVALNNNDKNCDMPKQLPELESSPQNFDLAMFRPDGCDTPKFNDEDSSTEENIYVKKRLMLQARKELYA